MRPLMCATVHVVMGGPPGVLHDVSVKRPFSYWATVFFCGGPSGECA